MPWCGIAWATDPNAPLRLRRCLCGLDTGAPEAAAHPDGRPIAQDIGWRIGPLERIDVGGAFGGKTICTVELEAALLCVTVGTPVKVQWTRAQEFRQGFHRPPSSHRIRARLRDGRLHDWQHHFASSHILFTAAGIPVWLQRITDIVAGVGDKLDVMMVPKVEGPWDIHFADQYVARVSKFL